MSVQIPDLIIQLIQNGDGFWDYELFTATQEIDVLRNIYNKTSTLTPENLQRYYDTSAMKDNFLDLFDPNGKDRVDLETNNLVVKEYKSLVENAFGNKFYVNDPAAYANFLKVAEKALTIDLNNSERLIDGGQVGQADARFIFLEKIAYQSQDAVDRYKLKGVTYLDVLKAYSFWLSLTNFRAAEDKVNKVETKANKGKLEDRDLTTGTLQLINMKAEAGTQAFKELDDIVVGLIDARNAVNASKFNKQRYLIENMDSIHELSEDRFNYQLSTQDINYLGGNEFGQLIGIEQTKILKFTNSSKNAMNKISGAVAGTEMFKMPTFILSKLVPEIRIYKVLYTEDMFVDGEVEIKFPTMFQGGEQNEDDFLTETSGYKNNPLADPYEFVSSKRGYGIKSFSWEYKGSDPFSVDRDISAVLELYFQDFSEFTRIRPEGYRYVDLLLPTTTGPKKPLTDRFKQSIRIKAGWAVPDSFDKELLRSLEEAQAGNAYFDLDIAQNVQKQIASIKASQVDLVLEMEDYNISFDSNGNGASTITINYRARAESMGKNRLINVIGATEEESKTVEYLEGEINSTKDSEKREELRKRQQDLFERIRSLSSKRFINKLMDNRSIYWRKLNLEETMISALGKAKGEEYFKKLYPEESWNPDYKDGLEISLEQIDPTRAGRTNSTGPRLPVQLKDLQLFTEINNNFGIEKPETVMYTFLGDILQVALQNAVDSGTYLGAPQQPLEKMRVILLDFRVGENTYNLADLPIEMNVFLEFMQTNIGQKNEHTKSFINFTRELLADVLTNSVERYFNLKDGTTRSFKIGYVETNENLKTNDVKSYDLLDDYDVTVINEAKKQTNLVIYSDSPNPEQYKIFDYAITKARDENNGLHHFSLGSKKSIVKNISFDRVDLEYAREQRLTVNLEDPYALLMNVFNVNMSMFGNNFFRPGSYIYVDPKIMGNLGNPWQVGSISNIMGLGGYHIITGVKNSINLNSFETTIDAVFETSGDGVFSLTQAQKDKDNSEENGEEESD